MGLKKLEEHLRETQWSSKWTDDRAGSWVDMFRAYAEPDEPEPESFRVGDVVECIDPQWLPKWGGEMVVNRIGGSGIVRCQHPTEGAGGFIVGQLRLVPPLKPGDEVEIEGVRPTDSIRLERTALRPCIDGSLQVRIVGTGTGNILTHLYVQPDLIRRKP